MTEQPSAARSEHFPALMLALATIFWGFGFTWARDGAWAVNESLGLGKSDAVGQVWLLLLRFLLAALLWLVIFPAARRGWTMATVRKSILAGAILGAGLVVQHVGLAGAGPSVTAFLTSLTILFVPLMSAVIFRKPPRVVMWGGVAVAMAGIWLMTGARANAGFGWGEACGLGCAIIFSTYLFVLNRVSPGETPARLSAGQFLVCALVCMIVLLFLPGVREAHLPSHLVEQFRTTKIIKNLALLTLLPTIGSFGLMIAYQPRIEPTRAALIYMLEPLFAAIYAVMIGNEHLPLASWIGAGLILIANVVTELWPTSGASGEEEFQPQMNTDEHR